MLIMALVARIKEKIYIGLRDAITLNDHIPIEIS